MLVGREEGGVTGEGVGGVSGEGGVTGEGVGGVSGEGGGGWEGLSSEQRGPALHRGIVQRKTLFSPPPPG